MGSSHCGVQNVKGLRSGQEVSVRNLTGWVGSAQELFKSSRVGSGWVKSYSNLAGRVGSGRYDVVKSHGSIQVGSRGDENLTGRARS